MATIIDLGKLRFEYRGEYNAATTYEANDVVKYGGNLYVYKYGLKTSGNTPQTGSLYWDLMVEGFKFEGAYDSDATYNIGDGFSYGGLVYITTANSVSGTRPPDSAYSTFVDGIQYEGVYNASTEYQKSDIVKYGPKSYIATEDPAIGANPLTSAWEVFADGISFDSAYDSSSTYKPGQSVKWGNKTWVADLDVAAGDSPNTGAWTVITEGQTYRDSYDAAVKYYEHDIVTFGGNAYRAQSDNILGAQPDTSASSWQKISSGLSAVGTYDAAQEYNVNELVTYGNGLYRALRTSTGATPDTSALDWEELTPGVDTRSTWTGATEYFKGDIVTNGNKSYIKNGTTHTSAATFDSDASNWTVLTDKVRYRSGGYDSTGTYLVNDIVQFSTSSYIALQDFTASGNFGNEITDGKWELFAQGGGSVLPSITAGTDAGKFLGTTDGVSYTWSKPGETEKVYYVAVDGLDDSDLGTTIDTAWATLKFATENVTGPATIFVKEGTYTENLPITVPADVTIIGDGQRNTIIQPQSGDSQETMFYVNNGVLMENFQFKGLTGFQLSDSFPHDIEEATIGGVYFRLDPAAVITKSPYIKESTAFSSGGIGAVIDGGLNSNPANNGSMVFHTFTQVHDGGAGFWVRKNGKSEIVSCFTYYCDFGFTANSGGKIRALNCNNSYGVYGSVSEGFDSNETATTGAVRGVSLHYDGNTISGGTEFPKGTYITGEETNGATGFNGITRAVNASVHSPNHGLVSGQRISFSDMAPSTWASLFTADSYWVTVTDSSNFIPYTDSARTAGIDTQLAGGRNTSVSTITDIARQDPIRITVSSADNTDSYAPHYIQSVGGMTQINDRWVTFDSGAGTTDTILFAREAKNTKIRVRSQSNTLGVSFNGDFGEDSTTYADSSGAKNPTITLWRGSRYRFLAESSGADVFGGRFYLSTDSAAAWDSSDPFANEFTTGVLNSRNSLDGDSSLDSSIDGLLIEVGSTAPDTLYYYFDSADSGTALGGTINIVNPPFIDGTSYSVYTSGGQIRLMDSGDYFDSANWLSDAPKGFVINTQPSQDKIYVENITFPGFSGGETITDSSGSVTADLLDSNFQRGQSGFVVTVNGLTAEPKPAGAVQFSGDVDSAGTQRSYVIQTVSEYDSDEASATLTLAQEKLETNASDDDTAITIRYNYSQVRLTGHDFLQVGTGGIATTNYPGTPTQDASQGNEVIETAPGRVYYVSTDQDGNFRVGNYFRIDQATGRATLDASAFDLSGLTSLRLGSIGAQIGETINEFSSDTTLSGNSNLAVPTEKAVKGFVETQTEVIAQSFLTGAYDSANTTFEAATYTGSDSDYVDSSRDSGGLRPLAFTSGNFQYSQIVYDSTSGQINTFRETTTIGDVTVTQDIALVYNSDGTIERITVTEV